MENVDVEAITNEKVKLVRAPSGDYDNKSIEIAESMNMKMIQWSVDSLDWKNRSNGFVLHENIDMRTVTLVTRELHDTMEGGFSHMGGVALAKYVKAHMGSAYFERLMAAAASGLATATN